MYGESRCSTVGRFHPCSFSVLSHWNNVGEKRGKIKRSQKWNWFPLEKAESEMWGKKRVLETERENILGRVWRAFLRGFESDTRDEWEFVYAFCHSLSFQQIFIRSLRYTVQSAIEPDMGQVCSQDAYRLMKSPSTNQQAIPKRYDMRPNKEKHCLQESESI